MLACSDDSCGLSGAQIAAEVAQGTYYIGVSSSTPGDFTLNFQHMPYTGNNYSYTNGILSGTGATAKADFVGIPHFQPPCSKHFMNSGEDAYWFVSCGKDKTLLSLCNGGGFFDRSTIDKDGFPLYYITRCEMSSRDLQEART